MEEGSWPDHARHGPWRKGIAKRPLQTLGTCLSGHLSHTGWFSSAAAAAFVVEQPKRVQRHLIGLMARLGSQPGQPCDYSVKDSTGRWHQVLRAGKFSFTYWADEPVKELRIVEIVRL